VSISQRLTRVWLYIKKTGLWLSMQRTEKPSNGKAMRITENKKDELSKFDSSSFFEMVEVASL